MLLQNASSNISAKIKELLRSSGSRASLKLIRTALESERNAEPHNALLRLKEAAHISPSATRAWAEMARLLGDLSPLEALEPYQRAAAAECPDAESGAAILAAALRLFELKQIDEQDVRVLAGRLDRFSSHAGVASFLCELEYIRSHAEQAEMYASKAVAAAPESCLANMLMARSFLARNCYDSALEMMERAGNLDPAFTIWFLLSRPPFAVTMTDEKFFEKVLQFLGSLLKHDPYATLLPHRYTPWHKKTQRKQYHELLDAGLPSCFFISMAKSATTTLGNVFTSGIGLVNRIYSISNIIIPEWASIYSEGAACQPTHTTPVPDNIEILKMHKGVSKFVVNLRDPRQQILSMTHHYLRYKEFHAMNYLPSDVKFEDALQIMMNDHFEKMIYWIEGWYEQKDEFSIIFSTYESFMQDKKRHVDYLIDAYGYHGRSINYDAVLNLDINIDDHFRKGSTTEWRDSLSRQQIEWMNDRLSDEVLHFFGWKR